jgi:hypothetical protein
MSEVPLQDTRSAAHPQREPQRSTRFFTTSFRTTRTATLTISSPRGRYVDPADEVRGMMGVPKGWRASEGRLRIGLARGLHPPGEVPRLYRGVCPAPELARWHRWRKPLGESVRGVRLKSGSFSDPVGAVFASCKWGRRAFCIVIFDRRSAGVSTGRRTGDCARRVGRGVRGELGMDSAHEGGGQHWRLCTWGASADHLFRLEKVSAVAVEQKRETGTRQGCSEDVRHTPNSMAKAISDSEQRSSWEAFRESEERVESALRFARTVMQTSCFSSPRHMVRGSGSTQIARGTAAGRWRVEREGSTGAGGCIVHELRLNPQLRGRP